MKLHDLGENLYCWSVEHGKVDERYYWNSYVLKLEDNALLIVDPLPSDDELKQNIESVGKPQSILLTCNYHSRDAANLARRWDVKISLNEKGKGAEDISIDRYFHSEESIWKGVQLIDVSPLSWSEEVAIVFGKKLLILDALVGGRRDLGIEKGSVGIHPNRFLMGHVANLERAKAKLAELAELEVCEMHFGHGYPVLSDVESALASLSDLLPDLKELAELGDQNENG